MPRGNQGPERAKAEREDSQNQGRVPALRGARRERPASVCAPGGRVRSGSDPGPRGWRGPPAPARALQHFPALTTVTPLLLSGATAAGSPLPDAARAAPATVARETKLHRPVTSPRGQEGAGSSESDRGLGAPGAALGTGKEGGAGVPRRGSCA